MRYTPDAHRYDIMHYRRCGRSGLKLPAVSLGLWHNFGHVDHYENARAMIFKAFDLGITHFDLANNYGPPPGSAEENFGRIFRNDLKPFRDELVISTKAGYEMWPGPYGDFGSRKYLIASLDQSLKRMGLDYVDIFYHHRPDPETPLHETALALDHIVRNGRALYVGVSNYNPRQTTDMAKILKELNTPFIIHQPKYNMFYRNIESGLTDVLKREGLGCIVFSPLAQGLLTDKYLNGIPNDSRAANPHGFLKSEHITGEAIEKVKKLSQIANARGQSMTQMAVAWTLRLPEITSALIGARTPTQIEELISALEHLDFEERELQEIEAILA